VGYTLAAGGSAPTPAPFLPPALWDNADGGLVSTVEDMAKWDRALSAGTIVSARSLEEMVRRTTLNDGRVQDYGYGLVVNVIGAHRVVGHGGSRPGVATNFTRWPDDGVSVVVLCNAQLGGNDPFEIARSIARLYAPAVP
jgi:CubicO group peptidase (beta-lactamase class C family)